MYSKQGNPTKASPDLNVIRAQWVNRYRLVNRLSVTPRGFPTTPK